MSKLTSQFKTQIAQDFFGMLKMQVMVRRNGLGAHS